MRSNGRGPSLTEAESNKIAVGCLTAFVIEQSKEMGCHEHADAMEECLTSLIATMPEEHKRRTLMLSYDIALKDFAPAPVRLKLVHSRD